MASAPYRRGQDLMKGRHSLNTLLNPTQVYVKPNHVINPPSPRAALSRPRAERLNEADYDDITDHPSVAVAMETAQVVLAMEAGTGRSSGEVNTPL